jgi:acyl carrier protein
MHLPYRFVSPNEFEVEFPDRLLRRDVFESVASIASAIQTLIRG